MQRTDLTGFPEHRLLLDCIRVAAEDTPAGPAPERAIDWRRFVRLAHDHGVIPRAFQNVKRASPEAVPPPIAALLRGEFGANAKKTTALTAEIVEAEKLLREHGVEAVAFKGPVLAQMAYGEIWRRSFSDMDLLVRPEQVLDAKRILSERGYQADVELSAAQDRLLVSSSPHAYAYTMPRGSSPLAIDLHWRVGEAGHPAFPNDLNAEWSRLIEMRISDATLRTFSPEDTLRLISGHAAKHDWKKLKWICDIGELIHAQPGMDWDAVLQGAARTGRIGTRTLLTSALIAHRMVGAPLPDAVRQSAEADAVVADLAAQAFERYRADAVFEPHTWARSFDSDFAFGRMAGSPLGKLDYYLRYCAYRVIAPDAKDRRILPLPAVLTPLYWVFRPFRMLAEYGLAPLKSVGARES